MSGFVQNHPGDWPVYLPAVEGAVRACPQKALGDRSPIEVVMGLKPKMPFTLSRNLPVEDVGVERYVEMLVEDLAEVYKEVYHQAEEEATPEEGAADGAP